MSHSEENEQTNIIDRGAKWWRAYLGERFTWLVDWLNLPQNRDSWRRKHAANIVTIVRGIMAVVFLIVLFVFGHNYVVRASFVFLLGVDLMFDGVDGMLAERLDRQTRLGAILDVVVDHFVILLGLLIYLWTMIHPYITDTQMAVSKLSIVWFIIMFVISVVIAPMRDKRYGELNEPIKSLPLGKLKFVWITVMSGMTLYIPVGHLMPMWLTYVALFPGAVLATLSVGEYAKDLIRVRSL